MPNTSTTTTTTITTTATTTTTFTPTAWLACAHSPLLSLLRRAVVAVAKLRRPRKATPHHGRRAAPDLAGDGPLPSPQEASRSGAVASSGRTHGGPEEVRKTRVRRPKQLTMSGLYVAPGASSSPGTASPYHASFRRLIASTQSVPAPPASGEALPMSPATRPCSRPASDSTGWPQVRP